MDSAIRSNIEPGGVLDLGMVQVTSNEDGNLKSRKFIVAMTLILISSIFTGMGMMSILEWMGFTGAVGAAYLGVNIYQKKTL